MNHHSSVELDATQPMSPDVPLSERPLVADDQNTVITSGSDVGLSDAAEVPLSATAQEIRDRLFAPPDSEENAERDLRIGHFEVEQRIGSGGMGAVFRARDLELSRYVALKVLHPGVAADPALVARFRNEARACAQLNHDNVARVFFTGEQDGVHYIVYEFADGLTIKEMISDRGRLTPAETVNYAIQATLALSHIDAAGIVHRDIKPSNIILTHSGRIKVVDLGLARRESTDSVGDLTVAGTTLGTFDYIAPEQARDPRTADIRSDIYSLGCTVYHMLTGQPPYPEGTALQKLLDHQGKSPPDPRTVARDVPAELAVIVQKMMNTDPKQRYQDPGQLLADLLALATYMGLRSVPAEGIVWRRMAVTHVRELSGALFLTGAVFAICITALIMHFAPGPQDLSGEDIRSVLQSMFPPRVELVQGPAVPPADSTKPDSLANGATDTSSDTDTQEATPPNVAGAESTPVTPEGSELPVPVQPFVIVRADQTVERAETLNVAWDMARSGDTIQLDFDGPLELPTRALTRLVSGRIITLRAAPRRRPMITFAGEQSQNRQGQLFYLSNNVSLTVIDVNFRMTIPREAMADRLSLFHCSGPNQVTLRNCSVEVRNPSRREASVFHLTDSATDSGGSAETSLTLNNVCVRGSGDLVVVGGRSGGAISASQCAFALDGSLINGLGAPRQGTTASARESGRMNFSLTHTSSILAQPVIRMRDSESLTGGEQERDQPEIVVDAYSNVFASLSPDGVLIQSGGNAYLDEMQELLSWRGSHNLYCQYEIYWALSSGSLDRITDQLDFDQWQLYWYELSDTYEEVAAEFGPQLWMFSEELAASGRTDLASLPVEYFRLDHSQFFNGDVTSAFNVDRERAVPGVETADLPRFSEATAVLPPADVVPATDDSEPDTD
ncbi:MAG: serine/threonine-protein kinase [Fuerstiella sp.]